MMEWSHILGQRWFIWKKTKNQQFSTIAATLAWGLLEEPGAYSDHSVHVLSFLKWGTICRCQMFLRPLCYTPQVMQHIRKLLIMTWCKGVENGRILNLGVLLGHQRPVGGAHRRWGALTDASHQQLGTADLLSCTAAGLKWEMMLRFTPEIYHLS